VNAPNPASLILLGVTVLVAASSREGTALFLAGLVLGLVGLAVAKSHLLLLLRRSRWLLLTMLVMFGWMTAGTPLPAIPGASREGLLLAAENIARLVLALSVVALMLNALSAAELVAGLRSLLAPLAVLKVPRDRIAVRLALTLGEVEASRNDSSGPPGGLATHLVLPASTLGPADVLVGVVAGGLAFGAWLT
jgi:energy-coupling factor transport system permease protein